MLTITFILTINRKLLFYIQWVQPATSGIISNGPSWASKNIWNFWKTVEVTQNKAFQIKAKSS